jgi:hypothetical protein
MQHEINPETGLLETENSKSNETESSRSGFGSRDNKKDFESRHSKLGNSEGSTTNVLASSADISSVPSSLSTGEGPDEEGAEPENFSEATAQEYPEENVYASGSDELEMGRAVLEDGTQSPGIDSDPSNAREKIQETDDFKDLEETDKP